jgi:hypothetical protein
VQLSRIFLVFFAIGIAAGYASWRQSAPSATPPSVPAAEPATSLNKPLIAEKPHASESLAEVEERAPIASLNVTRPGAPPPAAPPKIPSETRQLRAKADALAADEPLDPEQVRVLLEQVLTGKLPKELSPRDYDRMAQAFLRARAAERVLKGLDETPETEPIRAEYRDALNETVSEVEGITGLKVAQIKPLIDSEKQLNEQPAGEYAPESPEQ